MRKYFNLALINFSCSAPTPKIKFRERSSSVGDENDRDSGLFTGSDYDKVESWMKNTPKLPGNFNNNY